MRFFRSPRWLIAFALCVIAPALVFSEVVPEPPVRLLRALLDAGSANRLVVNDGSGVMSDAAAITASRVLLSDANGIPVANGALSTNRVNYWNGTGLVSAAALTSGRVLLADANGLPTNNPALTTNRIVYQDASGLATAGALTSGRVLLADANGIPTPNAALSTNQLVYANATGLVSNAALTASRIPLTDANGLLTVHSALTINRLVLSGADGLLDVNAALTANRALQSDASGFPVASATVSDTELGYLDNATSNLQAQINALGSGSVVLLGTYSPSAASSVDITSKITASYNRYLVLFNIRVSSDGANVWMRTDSSNGASFDSGATDYANAVFASTTNDPEIILAPSTGVGNATNEGISGSFLLSFVGSASMYPICQFLVGYLNTSTALSMNWSTCARRTAAAIDALQLLPSAGTITGSVEIYGYKNSWMMIFAAPRRRRRFAASAQERAAA